MSIATRLSQLERRVPRQDPELIIIHGGLDPREPRETTIDGERLVCGDDEPIAAFHRRCVAAGKAAGRAFVILGGLPRD